MEESVEILISSMRSLGLDIPPQITSIKDLDSSSFFSISSQSLNLLNHNNINASFFPTSLPDPMAEKVKSCTDLATSLQHLGYPSEISFHQFLYPSEEDLYKMVRFLVEKLSELSEGRKAVNVVGDGRPKTLDSNAQLISQALPEKNAEHVVFQNNQKVRVQLEDMRLEVDAPASSSNSAEAPSHESNRVCVKLNELITTGRVDKQETMAYTEELKKAAQVDKTDVVAKIFKPEKELSTCGDLSPKLRCKVESIFDQETVFPEAATGNDLELHHAEEEHEVVKEAMRMIIDNEHYFSSYVEQLNEQIAARQENLQELKNQWDIDRKSLEEERWKLLESHCVNTVDCQPKLQKLKDIDREIHSVTLEISKREEECAKLAGDLKKQPKAASRRSYIQRITEITKNSRKLDTDVERILKETRELNLESNSIEERLHRTYAVVDEKILREAKKDPVGRQAYRLLTNIHESFEKIRDQILAADKARREVSELEMKLSTIASRSLDMEKLQAELDAMRRENEHLEKTLLNR